jgi:hypothetical protein
LISWEHNEHIQVIRNVHAGEWCAQSTGRRRTLEAAADQAIAACGGDARGAVKAPIVANEYLESEVCELTQAVSHAYTRGRFKTYTG